MRTSVSRRVLVGAYACEPHSGSEPSVGWNWAREAALAGNEVHVVTRSNNRKAIEAELEARPLSGLYFHYLDLWSPLTWIKRHTGTFGLVTYYYLWQIALSRKARRMNARYSFDLAHHVTFANDWLPTGLALTPLPLIWGPIGGSSHRVPPTFSSSWSVRARAYEWIRLILQETFLRFDPMLRLTRRRAVVALPYTREASDALPASLQDRTQVVVHIGVKTPSDHSLAHPGTRESIRVVSGGRLVHWKGFDLLIEALARNRRDGSRIELVITGDGPERRSLESLVKRHRLESTVRFTGRLPSLADVYAALAAADVYALLTLRDGPPVAILEAMHARLPILYLDLGAPAELVPQGAGFPVPVETRRETIVRIADALRAIEADPEQLASMGDRAYVHAVEFHSWDVVGRQIESIYGYVDSAKHG
jgi:glycosyltransferase involved in cell wall biosynthesis